MVQSYKKVYINQPRSLWTRKVQNQILLLFLTAKRKLHTILSNLQSPMEEKKYLKVKTCQKYNFYFWRVFCKKFFYIHTFIAPSLDFRDVVSKKDVSAVTMNMTGRVGLGLTPRYKIEMVKEYLSSTKPDILIVQDCIDCSDMVKYQSIYCNNCESISRKKLYILKFSWNVLQ